MLSLVNDVTARKRLEGEIEILHTDLACRAAELESANRELETFSHTVSHDLRTPLAGIAGYADLLREQCGSRLDEQSRGYVEQIIAAGDQLATLDPGTEQVWEALRALYLIGQPEDIPAIQPYERELPEIPDHLRQQAVATERAIREQTEQFTRIRR